MKPTIRASELAAFDYCKRAWYYARSGVARDDDSRLHDGDGWHAAMEWSTRRSTFHRYAGLALVLAGLTIALLSRLHS